MRKVSRTGLSTAPKLLTEDLPLCGRFREREPRAFSEPQSWSSDQRKVCESATKLAESCSTAWREADEKKTKTVMMIMLRFTKASLYKVALIVNYTRRRGQTWVANGR